MGEKNLLSNVKWYEISISRFPSGTDILTPASEAI